MRTKTANVYQRAMHQYAVGFDFRTPYQILLDADFCQISVKQKIDLLNKLPETLQGPTRPFVTECTIQELRRLGPEHANAVRFARSCEKRRCRHVTVVSSEECFSEIIDSRNPHNYCVATQNLAFRKKLRSVPGVPLLYIKSGVIVLEPLSDITKAEIRKLELQKLVPAKEIERLRTAKIIGGEIPQANDTKPIKKKQKQPNPLSVKKKQKPAKPAKPATPAEKDPAASTSKKRKQSDPSSDANIADDTDTTKKKRKRNRKKRSESVPSDMVHDTTEKVAHE